jgi:hypothetical protein
VTVARIAYDLAYNITRIGLVLFLMAPLLLIPLPLALYLFLEV